jgi:hypothetical protein
MMVSPPSTFRSTNDYFLCRECTDNNGSFQKRIAVEKTNCISQRAPFVFRLSPCSMLVRCTVDFSSGHSDQHAAVTC